MLRIRALAFTLCVVALLLTVIVWRGTEGHTSRLAPSPNMRDAGENQSMSFMTITLKNDYTSDMDFDIFATDHYATTLSHFGTITASQFGTTTVASGYPRYTIYGTASAASPGYVLMHDGVYTLDKIEAQEHSISFIGDDMGIAAFSGDPPPTVTDEP
jgi:hypothetical protein